MILPRAQDLSPSPALEQTAGDHRGTVLDARLADGELLRDFVAGYQFHGAITLGPHMNVGDTLDLVREPDNPHDPLAVALRWRRERVGYIPRRLNAEIPRRLDARDALLCQITWFDQHADLWQRVELSIRQVPAP